jgi:hypothetical protein
MYSPFSPNPDSYLMLGWDHAGAFPGIGETGTWISPRASMRNTSLFPRRLDEKAIILPSGDQAGSWLEP